VPKPIVWDVTGGQSLFQSFTQQQTSGSSNFRIRRTPVVGSSNMSSASQSSTNQNYFQQELQPHQQQQQLFMQPQFRLQNQFQMQQQAPSLTASSNSGIFMNTGGDLNPQQQRLIQQQQQQRNLIRSQARAQLQQPQQLQQLSQQQQSQPGRIIPTINPRASAPGQNNQRGRGRFI
jgi:hypothetical protein